MSQVTQGVAAMHALQPPLIHRDIKIENVLISANNEYKLCDFGSVCGIIRPLGIHKSYHMFSKTFWKNTTAQYRSPEMIDTFRGLPIDEKSDIWALGIFLYKLCYYTTPFEKGGDLAILSGSLNFHCIELQ
ncbi:BBT_HP_G0131720.mRNA.1.CDS.1 [Saccharomyces cerevisiae]|nr:BBT_HP_G0131720.mRNA.1.CDS.1 [Saccharomyces cerevisiae]CAI6975393.1 BBT_HP_G0131720.mRNA.1.CDS.1 [Saccharomyces cerevisiae]